MNNEIESTVARAIEHARQVSWSARFIDWANAWLDGSDRTTDSALAALHKVANGYLAPTWERQCLMDAATAAIQLAKGRDHDAVRWARAATEARPDPRPQDDLFVGDDREPVRDPLPRRTGAHRRHRPHGRRRS
jgi:hypothetical protein